MYERLTYQRILERMLSRVSSKMDTREGSVIYDAIAPAALELNLMYIELDYILKETFGDTASREYLIRRAYERELSPYPSSKAVLEGVFTPAELEIPIGARFNLNELNYAVKGKISGGIYQMECESTGTVGNKNFGRMTPIAYIEGLAAAELTKLLIPGEDEEETEAFRKRYLESFDSKAYGGNKKDYMEKTNAIPGVGATKVIPVWNGGGTVKLVILDSEFNPATDVLIQTVQEIIDPTQEASGDGVAPIGHVVTVVTANIMKIDIEGKFTFRSGYDYEQMEETIVSVIEEYLKELRQIWADEEYLIVRISQIESRILGIPEIIDIEETKLNGQDKNVTLGAYEVPVLGGISHG